MIKFSELDDLHVIHCTEEWMKEKLLKYATSVGLKWSSGESYTSNITYLNNYGKSHCYRIKGGAQGSLLFYQTNVSDCGNRYKIIHFNDLEFDEIEPIKKVKLVDEIQNDKPGCK